MILPGYKICYQPIPKNACTSLKSALYRLEAGEDFRPNRWASSIHATFPTVRVPPVPHHYFRFVVVRDPQARFLSLVRNRILHHHDAARLYANIGIDRIVTELSAEGATVSQDMFDDLAKRVVRGWKKLNNAEIFHHHALPQMHWIGGRLDSMQVYRIEQMEELKQALQGSAHRQINLYREQAGGPSLKEIALNAELVNFVKHEYVEDYQALDF
ncbi:MAG TPA: sulfotransferase family 2 domain-containing protein [Hyphomicrobiales bacterium]|nr:sulfotransferase family 2 domain-containing protein [Hyphomicrobiales bacterium]